MIDWNPRYLFRKLIPDEEKMDWFLAKVCNDAWNEQMDEGRPFEEAISEKVLEFPDHEGLIQAYFERWDEMLGGIINGTVEILSQLKEKNVPLYVLSNWAAETFALTSHQFEFLNWFDGIIISGERGIKKPDPAIYSLLLSEFNLNPKECVFIDDRKINIQAAEQFGIRGIVFDNAHSLKIKLIELGLL